MQAVILAAGKGTRMRPLTYDIPKAMLLLKGKPILEYTIDTLPKEVEEVIIVINYLGHFIEEYFGKFFNGRKITYVTQEKLDGTGGAMHTCKNLLKGKFLVVMGDDLYYKKDLEKLLGCELAILAYEIEGVARFGFLKTDKDGNLIEIIEKSPETKKRRISTNAFSLNEKFFDYDLVAISETEFGLPQTVAKMAKDFDVKIIPAKIWHPVGYPEDLEKAEKILNKFIK
jgi:bifunctional UDP-N-acetylglucosamine pyrophosphorylase/glucosamine-1-phosphate N-acetyltransferase